MKAQTDKSARSLIFLQGNKNPTGAAVLLAVLRLSCCFSHPRKAARRSHSWDCCQTLVRQQGAPWANSSWDEFPRADPGWKEVQLGSVGLLGFIQERKLSFRQTLLQGTGESPKDWTEALTQMEKSKDPWKVSVRISGSSLKIVGLF